MVMVEMVVVMDISGLFVMVEEKVGGGQGWWRGVGGACGRKVIVNYTSSFNNLH